MGLLFLCNLIIITSTDRPVTFLYNTLHYYESKLRDKPLLKRKLVNAVLGSLKDVRPSGWATTEAFLTYLAKSEVDATGWTPDLNYYLSLVNRMVDSILFNSIIHFELKP